MMRRNYNDDRKVRDAIETCLPKIDAMPSLRYDIMNEIRGEVKVKKKLSVGLVLMIVLLLVAVTALAVTLLHSKDFVDQVMVPIADENKEEVWTAEQIDAILQAAQDNGIEINDDIRREVESSDNIYKEELMRAFAKIDLGFYPASWSLEDQAWYDSLMVECGLRDERTRFLPEGDEISLAEARQIAKTYIYDHFSPPNDIFDEAYYTPYVQYMLTTDDDDQYCKRWDIEYEALNPETPSYYIMVTPSGQVEEEQSYQKIIERTNSTIPETLISSIDELRNEIDDDSFYTIQNMAAFRENYADIIAAVMGGNNDSRQYRVFEHLLEIPYGLPSSTDVTQEHAYQTALAEIKSKGWSDTWLERCHYTQSYREYSNEKPIWRICWKIDNHGLYHFFHEGDMPFGIVVTIDAQSGEVNSIMQLDEMDRYHTICEFPDEHDSFEDFYDDQGVG